MLSAFAVIGRLLRTGAISFVTALAICQPGVTSVAYAVNVFAFGANDFGQTGQGTDSGSTLIATRIRSSVIPATSIVEAAAGAGHSLLLANDGTVFGLGLNSHGQLGLGINTGNTLVATPFDTTNLVGRTVAHVEAYGHSLVLADDGTVFSFGPNSFGITGLGVDSGSTLIATPIDMSNLVGKKIKQFAAGNRHNLLLSEDGIVYSFGANFGGRTGLGTDSGATLIATPIDTTYLSGKKITQVAAGGGHSLLLADNGTVFSFGDNFFGQTGLGIDSGIAAIATPINTTNLSGRTIVQVAAGAAHSLLLADDGSVFSFGHNADGRTGLGTDVGSTLVPTRIDTTNLVGKTITQVAIGTNHNLLLADDGTVFSFGSNGSGRTGLGTDTGDTLVATPLVDTYLSGLRVTEVAAGAGHSLLLTVPEPSSAALTLLAGFALPLERTSRRPSAIAVI